MKLTTVFTVVPTVIIPRLDGFLARILLFCFAVVHTPIRERATTCVTFIAHPLLACLFKVNIYNVLHFLKIVPQKKFDPRRFVIMFSVSL